MTSGVDSRIERRRARDRALNACAPILRRALVCALGGRCAECGCEDLDELEVDHPKGSGYLARRLNSYRRARRYWKEYAAGVPQRPLCRTCNAVDGARKGNNPEYIARREQPGCDDVEPEERQTTAWQLLGLDAAPF